MLQSNQLILHRRLGELAPPLPWTSDGKAPAVADVIAELSVTSNVDARPNPLAALTTELTPTRAYLANLSADWDTFYASKRSANTRRRDRTKRKGLCESGELRLVTAKDPEETRSTLNILWSQKGR